MDAAEEGLRFALLAGAPGGCARLPVEAMRRATADRPAVEDDRLSVHRFAPESFLVVFSSHRACDAALAAKSVSVQGVQLFFRPWTRLVRAAAEPLMFRVNLEIEGIPAHAWSWRVARKILASSCWIESLDPATEDHSNLSVFKLTAWTDRPSKIPRAMSVRIAEHEPIVVHSDPETQRIFANVRPYRREKRTLRYEVLIHIRSIADFRPRPASPDGRPSSPSSDGDSGPDGNPDRSYGFSRGDGGPRLHGFVCTTGAPDGAAFGPGSGNRGATDAPAPRSCSPRRDAAAPALATTPAAPAPPSSPSSPATVPPSSSSFPATVPNGARGGMDALTGSRTPAKGAQDPRPNQLPPLDARKIRPFDDSDHFPEAEGDNSASPAVGISVELVPFEVQCPPRGSSSDFLEDPMRFESLAPIPKMLRAGTATAGDVSVATEVDRSASGWTLTPKAGLQTYKRRPRSDAAKDKAALPSPVALCFEPAEPEATELVREPSVQPEPQSVPEPAEISERAEPTGINDPVEPSASGPAQLATPAQATGQPNLKPTAPKRTKAKSQGCASVEEAKAATAPFLASVSQALQVPLASLPARSVMPNAPSTPGPRRSERLANQTLNSTVRSSKKGEILVMRKLGLCSDDGTATTDLTELAPVFQGPLDTSFSRLYVTFSLLLGPCQTLIFGRWPPSWGEW
ncbi:unnamed protein product [Urochloa humidicola]